jgi:glycosyltransferase involved in cell wall biosynthesis
MLEASVVTCTRNPRPDFFARVLESLRNQTLAPDKWEFLIVDNASNVPVARSCPISSHPRPRCVIENEIGVAAAWRRGMREAAADLIVFVDDDDVLDQEYLSQAVKIKHEWPFLGVWGSGCIRGEYEVEPPKKLETYLPLLAIRDTTGPCWSNIFASVETIPWAAGLCVRKEVACDYCCLAEKAFIQITGRRDDVLLDSEDKEIAHVCVARGLGIGTFPELKLTHLIPKHRISANYMVRLAEEIALSDFLLDYKWKPSELRLPSYFEMLLKRLEAILLRRGLDQRMRLAQIRGLAKGRRIVGTALKEKNGNRPNENELFEKISYPRGARPRINSGRDPQSPRVG